MNPLPPDDLRDIARRLHPLWDDLRGARLFVSGGTGFFGLWMLESLLWANEALALDAKVTVVGRSPERLPAHWACRPDVAFLQGDVRTFGFPSERITHVVHLATAAAPLPGDATYGTIVDGTARMLELAQARGARKFLFASSGAVYGPQPEGLGRIPEDGPFSPVAAPYAEGKRAAESLVAQASGLDATIARGFAFAGPGLPLDGPFAIGNFVRDALAGRPIEVRGDGTARRSYLDAADLAVWLWTILLRGEPGRAYNVGSEGAVSIHDLACLVSAASGNGTPVRVGAADPTKAFSSYVPDTGRARRELGLQESYSLEEVIARMIAYHRTAGNAPALLYPPGVRGPETRALPGSEPKCQEGL